MRESTPRRDVLLIVGMTLLVAIPAALTHMTVRVPVSELRTVDDPTPFGYTVSLTFFLIPVVAIGIWHLWHPRHRYDRKALLWCAGVMTGLGVVLDLAFGYAFFEFPNEAATLGIRIPAWSWGDLGWIPAYLPLEEFGFYVFGALFMVAVYLWADLNWLQEYDPDTYEQAAKERDRIIEPSPQAVGVWLVLIAAGVLYRWVTTGGFAGYYVFLVGAGGFPSLFLYRTVKRFVNWRALAFAFGALCLVSVIWEATFGLPYEWWAFREDQMLGIYLYAWGSLPLEEVFLWLIGVWDAVMVYEFFRIYFRMERSARDALFGSRASA